MSIIAKRIELIGPNGRREVEAMFDSGASFSCIPPELAEKLGMVSPLAIPIKLKTAEQGQDLYVTEAIHLQFQVNGFQLSDEYMVVPGLSEETIIGAKTLQGWRIKLDFEQEEVIIDPKVTRLRI